MVFTYPYFETGKTGYTPKAGKTLVTTAKKNNLELTTVVLNDNNHYETQRILYEKMFKKYQNILLVSKNNFNKEHDDMILKNDIYYPLTVDEKKKIQIKLIINNNIQNKLIISLNNREVLEEIVYKKEKNESNISKDNWLYKIKKLFQKIF